LNRAGGRDRIRSGGGVTVAAITQGERVLSVSTPLGPNVFTLAGFTGREEISRLFSFQLDLLIDNDRDAPLDRLVGQPATVELALPGGGGGA
jgi:type VI secretion system secreted protein VgrG